jgi:energy-coupling factor transport system ATP-binding protein
MIEVKNLSHSYQVSAGVVIPALSMVNLNIQEGEFIGIAGRNGSGKSTLAKHFNALLVPKSGEGKVLVDKMDTRDRGMVWEIRQRVGMVFANPDNQMVAPIVEEDVAFGPENLGVPSEEIRQRVDWALAQVGMAGYQKRAPHLLSGGQKQRVAIAGALAMRPRYLVLDEPTSMLDPVGRQEVMLILRKLNQENKVTILLITHHMEELIEVDRLVVMDQGQLVLEGAPTQVFQEIEVIKSLGLDIPRVVKLGALLKQQGIMVPPESLSVKNLVDFLNE